MEFNDSEYSWQVFVLLESFKDGASGAWDITGVLGKPILELDEQLVQDLLQWRWLKNIVESLQDKDEWLNEPEGKA